MNVGHVVVEVILLNVALNFWRSSPFGLSACCRPTAFTQHVAVGAPDPVQPERGIVVVIELGDGSLLYCRDTVTCIKVKGKKK